jgi:hypothetical protein
MRRVDVHVEAAEGRINALLAPPTPLTLFWSRICDRPATIFIILSLVFGSLVVFATPPLRGPDEIAHFLRIYSYVRGDVLPPNAVDGRKGIYIEHELNTQLQFFRSAEEWFAGAREAGVRLDWPPFRPDTRHNLEGLRLSSSTGLCLTTTNVSN